MMSSGADIVETTGGEGGRDGALRLAWRTAVCVTILTGILHLLNLVGWGRVAAGPVLLTPFRAAFISAWILLIAMLAVERRLPRPDAADALMLVLTSVFLIRAALEPATFSIALNWLSTAAGMYFLLRLGIRSRRDARVVIFAVTAAVLAVSFFGLAEYAAKTNPLFNAIDIDTVGSDARIFASDQFYRIRSLAGHPGFAAAIILAGIPLLLLVLWRRRVLLAGAMLTAAAALMLTFSRGSWLLAVIFLLPVLAARCRYWLWRNLRWLAPAILVPGLLIAIDYWNREEAFVDFDQRPVAQQGMVWSRDADGHVALVEGGISPFGNFVYFEIDDLFLHGDQGPATVVVHFRDNGRGALRIDYYSRDRDKADPNTGLTATPSVNKTGTGEPSVAAFYLEDPVFDGHLNRGADFRVVDDDNRVVIERVDLEKGKLKLPAVIAQQWVSRSASLSTRASLFPFAWDVFRDNPWGVGMFNSPGTGNHAVDSLPLTWLMEFGWVSALLLGAIGFILIREVVKACRAERGPAAVVLLSIVLIMAHGGHLMILYDKPSIVMLSSLLAVYVSIRPWRKNGPDVELGYADCREAI